MWSSSEDRSLQVSVLVTNFLYRMKRRTMEKGTEGGLENTTKRREDGSQNYLTNYDQRYDLFTDFNILRVHRRFESMYTPVVSPPKSPLPPSTYRVPGTPSKSHDYPSLGLSLFYPLFLTPALSRVNTTTLDPFQTTPRG